MVSRVSGSRDEGERGKPGEETCLGKAGELSSAIRAARTREQEMR